MTIDSAERRQSTASQVVSELARRGSTDTRRSSVKSEQAAAAVAAAAAAAAAASSAAAAAAAAAAALAGLFQQEQSPVENGKGEEEGEECPAVQELCLEKEEEVAEELCPLHAEEFEEEHEVVDEKEKFDEQGAAEEEIVEKAAEEEIVEKAAEEEIVEKAAEEVVVNEVVEKVVEEKAIEEVVQEEQQPEPVGCSGKTKHTVHFRGPCWSQVLESSIEQLEEAFKKDVFEATGIEAKRLENLNFNCVNVLVVTFIVHYTAEDVHANEVHAKLRQYKFPRTTGLYPSKK